MDNGKRLPWYQWRTDDHARVTLGWPPLARLAYRELLDHQWATGELPGDPDRLRELVVGVTMAQWRAVWPYIDRVFPLVSDFVRRNGVLEEIRADSVAVAESRRRAAKKAAEDRWNR